MSTSYYPTQPNATPSLPGAVQLFLGLLAGMVLFIILLVAGLVGFSIQSSGHIFPGVSVAGVDLSGLTPQEAAARLNQTVQYPETGKIVFQDGSRIWVAKPVEVGLFLDPENSAIAAYRYGRQGNPLYRWSSQFGAWYAGRDLPPLMVYDEHLAQRYLEAIAAQVNLPVTEATLMVEGINITSQPGQVGRLVDINASLVPLESQLQSLSDLLVPLVITETPPAILDATAAANAARQILSEPLVLSLGGGQPGDPGPWTIQPQQLATMLEIQRIEDPLGARYEVRLKPDALRTYVTALGPEIARTPSNGRFIFNDETKQLEALQPSVVGRNLNLEASLQSIEASLQQGQHQATLVVDIVQPEVPTDATAVSLGITQLVSQHTSYFYGSSGDRMQNIQVAAANFHGLMVPPGATFSMAGNMADVTLDNGYAEALIIYGNRTIQGVGGGVCQVSTTLFRTAFLGGYKIVERHPHAYRVYYYEQTASGQVDSDLAGLDATVFVPEVDFKFVNDTPYWLLMETYFNAQARTLTWKFYSTSDGRSVEWSTTGLQNIVSPAEPVYTENPKLSKGEIRQVDWEVDGADVTITRTVFKDGQVFFTDTFSTHYLPWRSVFEYGPGTKNIPGQKDKKDE